MEKSAPAGEKSPFEHPDVAIFGTVINILLTESDRGAVLVGACVVDNFLEKLFEHVFPEHMNSKTRSGLMKYPGPLRLNRCEGRYRPGDSPDWQGFTQGNSCVAQSSELSGSRRG